MKRNSTCMYAHVLQNTTMKIYTILCATIFYSLSFKLVHVNSQSMKLHYSYLLPCPNVSQVITIHSGEILWSIFCLVCGNLVEGQLYVFVNSQFDCVLDIVKNNLQGVPGTISISFKKGYSCADFSCTNQMHYIKKVGWSNDTFLIVEAYDDLVLDTCSGVLTRENPTCGSSQLFKSIPAPDGNCYIVAQSMCSTDVIAAPGNDATCKIYAGVPVQSQGGSTTTWSFTKTSKCKYLKL